MTLYRVGPMVDLCRGPHVPNSGLLKAYALTKASASYWRGDAKNDHLQVWLWRHSSRVFSPLPPPLYHARIHIYRERNKGLEIYMNKLC